MTTFATDQEADQRLVALAERERRAWTGYRDRLRDLVGSQYAEAERDCWAELQAELRAVHGERAQLAASAAPDAA